MSNTTVAKVPRPKHPRAVLTVKPFDPADLGFPPMLPIELAMHTSPVADVCAAYNISKEQLVALTEDPLFIQAYQGAKEMLQKDGMSFKIKARMQAEELLKKSYALIHADGTPTAVKADLIKATVRWAGYEPKDGGPNGGGNNAFHININLGV